MTRIFLSLTLFSVALLGVNIVLGLRIGDYNGRFAYHDARGREILEQIQELKNERPRPRAQIDALQAQLNQENDDYAPINNRALVHMLFGVAAALVAVLVNSISATYFIGTSRWVREVVETYNFPRQWIAECNSLKRRTFAAALAGMLTAVAIIALGAAAHPGTIREGTAHWVTPHMVGALIGTAVISWMFYLQHSNITTNFELIRRIVAQVQAVRKEKGLDVDDGQEVVEKPVRPEYV